MRAMPGSIHRAALTAILVVTAAGGSKTDQPSAPPDALAELVAPIALYPDPQQVYTTPPPSSSSSAPLAPEG